MVTIVKPEIQIIFIAISSEHEQRSHNLPKEHLNLNRYDKDQSFVLLAAGEHVVVHGIHSRPT
jgi:hypothetical protein